MTAADGRCVATLHCIRKRRKPDPQRRRVELCDAAMFRAVISRLDAGVPNWLDKGDHPWGIIQMWWNQATDYPDPTIKKAPFDEIRDHLPPDTPTVTPKERKQQLRVRREGAQFRRIW